MKIEIGKLTYDIINYDEQRDISAYQPRHLIRFELIHKNYSEADFTEVKTELENNNNNIKIILDNGNNIIKQINNLLNCYYDIGNNMLIFAIII